MNHSPERSNLEVFAETLLALARRDHDLLVVTSDSRGSGKLTHFGRALPRQIIETGIAEQNMVGVSAGMAAMGKKVFAVSPSSFLTARALEQIKNDVAYSNFPVKLVGISAGVAYGLYGFTHHANHDLAALLAIPNVDIVVPFDNSETRWAVQATLNYSQPLYIRLGRKPMPDLRIPESSFAIGKANRLKEGRQACLIGCGETVLPALQASDLLGNEGISCGVVSMHTLRPFDFSALAEIARTVEAIVTCEEHSQYGGLGAICASYLMENRLHLPFKSIAIPDQPIQSGSQEQLYDFYGLSPYNIRDQVASLLSPSS